MNVIRRAIAGELLSSSSSSSTKSSLLLIRRHTHPNQTFPLEKPSCLYSTATATSPSRSKKQQVGTKTTNISKTQKENPPKPPRTWAEAARQAPVELPAKAELQKGLNGEEPRKELPRPSEIPWQNKVANSVNLIGRIQIPIQFGASSDGKYWAGTILSQGDGGTSSNSPFWIPIIFEGDLAHIAACHLKATDHVHIAGVLSSDPPPFTMKEGQANVQVMVHNINFVQEYSQAKKTLTSDIPEELDNSGTSTSSVIETKPDGDTASDPWRDLLQNPQNWFDYRDRKLNGSIKPKHPDFKHRSNRTSLWINSAPKWALLGLNGSRVDVQLPNPNPTKETKASPMLPKPTSQKESKGDDSWKDLIENPNKWWDNRIGKMNPKSPDFKRKDTGLGLWLDSCPPLLRSSLPPPKER